MTRVELGYDSSSNHMARTPQFSSTAVEKCQLLEDFCKNNFLQLLPFFQLSPSFDSLRSSLGE
jgi:hypothetical protein